MTCLGFYLRETWASILLKPLLFWIFSPLMAKTNPDHANELCICFHIHFSVSLLCFFLQRGWDLGLDSREYWWGKGGQREKKPRYSYSGSLPSTGSSPAIAISPLSFQFPRDMVSSSGWPQLLVSGNTILFLYLYTRDGSSFLLWPTSGFPHLLSLAFSSSMPCLMKSSH